MTWFILHEDSHLLFDIETLLFIQTNSIDLKFERMIVLIGLKVFQRDIANLNKNVALNYCLLHLRIVSMRRHIFVFLFCVSACNGLHLLEVAGRLLEENLF